MNNQTRHVAKVDVGKPPSGFQRWESAEVCFHGFADLPSTVNEEIDSPKFTCLGHQWMLEVYPGGDEYSIDGMVAVYLHNTSEDECINIKYNFTVRNSADKEVAHSAPHTFSHRLGESNDAWVEADLAKRSTILDALVEGTLTIEVRMRHMGQSNTSAIPFIPENPICQNILKKFMDEESADVAFEVGGSERGKSTHKMTETSAATTFHGHHFILQDGAPTLAELCKPGGGELTTVPITDVKPGIFRHLLYYVYGGNVTDEELEANAKDLIDAADKVRAASLKLKAEACYVKSTTLTINKILDNLANAKDLIDAADKFGIVSLKLKAEACYVKSTTLTIDNMLDNLLYADSKNCALLKETVMDFIVENGDDIIGKVSFDNVPGSMMTDLLTAMTREKKKDDASSDTSNFNTMRVGTLRKMLHEKGLDVDGSREAMIALLKENS